MCFNVMWVAFAKRVSLRWREFINSCLSQANLSFATRHTDYKSARAGHWFDVYLRSAASTMRWIAVCLNS